jgi:hypothetical protein
MCKFGICGRCDHYYDLSRLFVQQALPMGPGARSSTVLWYLLVYKELCARKFSILSLLVAHRNSSLSPIRALQPSNLVRCALPILV